MGFSVIMVFLVAYLFLIAPSFRKKNLTSLYGWDYAHRGLHDRKNGIPENSLLAFKRATVQEYGIELDVQRTKDDVLVVFHDDSLERLCGIQGAIRDFTLEQLKEFRLFSSSETIPTFEEVLKMVGGKVPLIVEIKTEKEAPTLLAAMVYEQLKGYRGTYCIESFDPRIVRWYKKKAPQVIRGQLAVGKKGKDTSAVLAFFIKFLLVNILSRPDFVAYQHGCEGNLSMWIMKNFFHIPLVAWTVEDAKSYRSAKEKFQLVIFEGFLPKN